MPALVLPVRTYNTYPEVGKAWVETNGHAKEAVMALPVDQTALVLVDVWDFHINQSNMMRSGHITTTCIRPVVEEARRIGLTIVHAPDLSVSRRYPKYRVYAYDDDDDSISVGTYPRWGYLRWDDPSVDSLAWPPKEFLCRRGDYEQYHRPYNRVLDQLGMRSTTRWIHPDISIADDDVVIGRGIELQRLCEDRKILHLIYAGFATNLCLQFKDYGVRAFADKGYNIVLLRDCTTAVESHDTVVNEGGTWQAIRELEAEVLATTESRDFLLASRGINSAPSQSRPT